MVSLETQMGGTAVSCGSASDAVTPISASLGVNPLWTDDEDTAESVELAAIPQFGGTSEIARMALMFTLWASVEESLRTGTTYSTITG